MNNKNKRRMILGLIWALIFAMVPVTVQAIKDTASAHAENCDSHVQRRADPFQEPYIYWDSLGPRGGSQWHEMKMNMNIVYLHCPNGDNPAKLKIKAFDYCWVFLNNEEHGKFQGVTFRSAAVDDDDKLVVSEATRVGDDGTRQNCKTFYVPNDRERWMFYRADPRYTARFLVHLNNDFDDDVVFRNAEGGMLNYIGPNSYPISDWY